jgi:hypothetical protein
VWGRGETLLPVLATAFCNTKFWRSWRPCCEHQLIYTIVTPCTPWDYQIHDSCPWHTCSLTVVKNTVARDEMKTPMVNAARSEFALLHMKNTHQHNSTLWQCDFKACSSPLVLHAVRQYSKRLLSAEGWDADAVPILTAVVDPCNPIQI